MKECLALGPSDAVGDETSSLRNAKVGGVELFELERCNVGGCSTCESVSVKDGEGELESRSRGSRVRTMGLLEERGASRRCESIGGW